MTHGGLSRLPLELCTILGSDWPPAEPLKPVIQRFVSNRFCLPIGWLIRLLTEELSSVYIFGMASATLPSRDTSPVVWWLGWRPCFRSRLHYFILGFVVVFPFLSNFSPLVSLDVNVHRKKCLSLSRSEKSSECSLATKYFWNNNRFQLYVF